MLACVLKSNTSQISPPAEQAKRGEGASQSQAASEAQWRFNEKMWFNQMMQSQAL